MSQIDRILKQLSWGAEYFAGCQVKDKSNKNYEMAEFSGVRKSTYINAMEIILEDVEMFGISEDEDQMCVMEEESICHGCGDCEKI